MVMDATPPEPGVHRYLVTDGRLDDVCRLSRRIGEAMSSRATVEQAKGVIMGARRCGPDDAFEALRQSARDGNLTVHEAARRIVDGAARSDRHNPRVPG
jgi:hypothetical protein